MTAMTTTIPLHTVSDREPAAVGSRPTAPSISAEVMAAASAEPLPAMVYRSEAFAEDLYGESPLDRRSAGRDRVGFSAGVGGRLSAGMARIWSTVPLGIAFAAGIGLPWTLPH